MTSFVSFVSPGVFTSVKKSRKTLKNRVNPFLVYQKWAFTVLSKGVSHPSTNVRMEMKMHVFRCMGKLIVCITSNTVFLYYIFLEELPFEGLLIIM